MNGTESKIDTPVARGVSRPVLYVIVSRLGNISPIKFTSMQTAAEYARELWPDQEQDPDRTGKGWDIQVVGVE